MRLWAVSVRWERTGNLKQMRCKCLHTGLAEARGFLGKSAGWGGEGSCGAPTNEMAGRSIRCQFETVSGKAWKANHAALHATLTEKLVDEARR